MNASSIIAANIPERIGITRAFRERNGNSCCTKQLCWQIGLAYRDWLYHQSMEEGWAVRRWVGAIGGMPRLILKENTKERKLLTGSIQDNRCFEEDCFRRSLVLRVSALQVLTMVSQDGCDPITFGVERFRFAE